MFIILKTQFTFALCFRVFIECPVYMFYNVTLKFNIILYLVSTFIKACVSSRLQTPVDNH